MGLWRKILIIRLYNVCKVIYNHDYPKQKRLQEFVSDLIYYMLSSINEDGTPETSTAGSNLMGGTGKGGMRGPQGIEKGDLKAPEGAEKGNMKAPEGIEQEMNDDPLAMEKMGP